MPQDINIIAWITVGKFSNSLNVDYLQTETTESNIIVDKDATPQQIQASFGQVNKRHQCIAVVEN